VSASSTAFTRSSKALSSACSSSRDSAASVTASMSRRRSASLPTGYLVPADGWVIQSRSRDYAVHSQLSYLTSDTHRRFVKGEYLLWLKAVSSLRINALACLACIRRPAG